MPNSINRLRPYPAGSPSLTLDFVNDFQAAVALVAKYGSFSTLGGTDYTRFNAAGLLVNAGPSVMRQDFYPNTTTPRGLIIEGSAQPFVTDPTNFTTVNWNKTANVTAVAATSIGLDGALSASTITDIGNGDDFMSQDRVIANNSGGHAATIYIRKTVGALHFPSFQMELVGGVTRSQQATINTNTGVITASTGNGTSGIRDYGLYWKVFVTVQNNASGNVTGRIKFYPAFNSDGTGVAVTATTGAQIVDRITSQENAFGNLTFVSASVATGIRSGDNLFLTTINPWFNPAEGTIVAEFELDIVDTGALRPVYSVNDFTVNNEIMVSQIAGAVQSRLDITRVGVSQAALSGSAVSINTVMKHAIAYKANDCASSFNGGAVTTDAVVTLPTVTRMYIGGRAVLTGFNGWIRKIKVYPTRRTNAELIAFST